MEEIKTTDELIIGDLVVFQGFTQPAGEGEFMPTIPMTLETIEGFNADMIQLKNRDVIQPKYRVRTVIRDKVRMEYGGYSCLAIARDEGEITDETFEEILAHEAMSEDTL